MILYLSRNESASLIDKVAKENSLHIRKMSGNFCLTEFIARDMRKYASCQYFCVERLAVTQKDSEFVEALQSFQMMYNARVIVIHESINEVDSFIRALVQIGVTDIVTAPDMTEKLGQIAECLSDGGMLRYKPVADRAKETEPGEEKEAIEETGTLAQGINSQVTEDEQFRFDCINVHIGVIGSTRRVGTTTVALGLANFISNHGGTTCYVALNENYHLGSIATSYNFDTEHDYYTYNGVDFYENMLPIHDYNFVITDYGDIVSAGRMANKISREMLKKYKESDMHLLCGASYKMHEVAEFAEALKPIKSVKPQIITYRPISEFGQLFYPTVTNNPIIIKPIGHNMLDYKINGSVFKSLIEKHIVETSKRFQ